MSVYEPVCPGPDLAVSLCDNLLNLNSRLIFLIPETNSAGTRKCKQPLPSCRSPIFQPTLCLFNLHLYILH